MEGPNKAVSLKLRYLSYCGCMLDRLRVMLCASLIDLWATLGVAFEYNTGNGFLYAGQAEYRCLGLATGMVDGEGCLYCVRVPRGVYVYLPAPPILYTV